MKLSARVRSSNRFIGITPACVYYIIFSDADTINHFRENRRAVLVAQAAEPASIIVSLECFYNSSFVFWRQISLPFRAKKLRMSCQYRVRSLGILPEILRKNRQKSVYER